MTAIHQSRFRLRAATQADHDEVDAAFGAVDLADAAQYRTFLQAQAAAFIPVEQAIDAADTLAVVPDWPERRRADLLRQDLSELGAAPGEYLDPPALASPSAVLGAIYVLEGSRLGGRLLARSLPADMPRRFIDSSDPKAWKRLVELLDSKLRTDDEIKIATETARAVFHRFSEGARRHIRDVHVDQAG